MIFNPRIQKSAGPKGTEIGTLEEGTLIKIQENGAPVEFYLAKHSYEPDLNGAGRELLVRKDCYNAQPWDAEGDYSRWGQNSLFTWLNQSYLSLFSASVISLIGTSKFPSQAQSESRVSLMSSKELNCGVVGMPSEGSPLPIYSSLQTASTGSQWTRTQLFLDSNLAAVLYNTGVWGNYNSEDPEGVRPIFTLPSTALVDDDLNLLEVA